MKKTTLAILFTALITLSCVFASCNAKGVLNGNNNNPEETTTDYSPLIKELENQILELKQNQYISNSTRDQEIIRLENLIAELKKNPENYTDTDTSTDSDTEKKGDSETGTDSNPAEAKFLYTTSGDKATITGYTGNDISLTIPSHIDGYAVVAIADDAFSSDELSSVVIPNGVENIGWFAFKECEALKTVTIPNSVTSIGYSAFPQKVNGFNIICAESSFAAKYAESYGISTTII